MTRVKRRVFGEDRMAYVLVAVGAVMFFAGVYAAVTGSQIVQVEAGWTSVIAGSMLVVGGVLTMALGLVLRAILQLKASLPLQAVAPVIAPATEADLEPMDAPPPPAFGEDSASAQVAAPEHVPEPSPFAPTDDPLLMNEPTAVEPSVEDPAPVRRPPPLRSLRPNTAAPAPIAPKPPPLPGFFRKKPAPIPPVVDVAPPVRPQDEDETPLGLSAEPEPTPHFEEAPAAELHEAHDTPEPSALDPVETAHPADDYKIETPSTSQHDLPLAAPGAVEPAEVDWLDRAFAEIDESLPVQERRHEPVAVVHPPEIAPDETPTHEAQPAEIEPEHAVPEPEQAAPELSPKPARGLPRAATLSPPTSAVIGRYEADGTSYVMYADGSIEAHSEAGTYRFASMSELKSFIEH